MMRTGHPGEAKAIAISSRPPGSLSQAELRGEEHGSPRPLPKPSARKKEDKPSAAQLLFGQLMSAQAQSPSQVTVSADWLSAFLLNNPTLLPLLHHGHLAAVGDTDVTPSTSIDEETNTQGKNLINNNNIEFSELNVKTENDVVLSGPESGIASGEEVTETDSSPASSSKESSPIANDIAPPSSRKRKSVDAIASLLFKKKCMMG